MLTPADITYATTIRCPCGAGLAYSKNADPFKGYWDCSAIMLGTAIESCQSESIEHTAQLPFVFYEIKSEEQPSAEGRTTRPKNAE